MFRKLQRRLALRKINRLAAAAITEAARAFESGEFKWTRGNLLVNEYGYDLSPERPSDLENTVGGCLLGGISKAAWVVTGKPAHGTPQWLLKQAVETRAYQKAFVTSLEVEGRVPHRFNDHDAAGPSDIVEVLLPARDADAETLPQVSTEALGEYGRIENAGLNPYNGNRAELLQSLYDEDESA